MKKVISIFVAIAMLTTIFSVMVPGSMFAAENAYDQNNLITLAASNVQIEVGKVTGNANSAVEIPIYFTGVPSNGIANIDFFLEYDPSILEVSKVEAGSIIKKSADFDFGVDKGVISLLFFEGSGEGTDSIYNDGVFAKIIATVKSTSPAPITLESMGACADSSLKRLTTSFVAGGVNVGGPVNTPTKAPTTTTKPTTVPGQVTIEVAKVEAAANSTVQIPIYLTGVPSKGIANIDFFLEYNPSILEVTSVVAGDIIKKSADFDFGVDKGVISLLFFEGSGDGIDSIVYDGVFATIVATVKSTSSAPITLESMGACADSDLKRLQTTFIAGGVNVGSGPVNTPTKAPNTPTKAPTTTTRPTAIPGQVTIEVARVEAAANSTVEIPIYLTGVPSKGIANIDFFLDYNPSILEVTSVVAGDIIKKSADFDFGVDKGVISLLFVEGSGEGIDSIYNDGVFAKIIATVKSTSPAPITLESMGACADSDLKRLQTTFIAGGVNVGNEPINTPTKAPNTPTQKATSTPTTRPTNPPTPQPVGDLKVEFYNNNTNDKSNSINPQFKVTNGGSSAVDLSKLTLRYYYTVDTDKDQTFWCDHAAVMGSDGSYNGITANVKGTFVKMSNKSNNADTYLEISFSGGSLPAGAYLQIQGRFAKNDWTDYTQSNDYSFRSNATSFSPWDKVTAYLNGSLVWGVEPGGSQPTTPPTQKATSTPTRKATSTPTSSKPTSTISGDAVKVVVGKVSGTVGQEVRIPITFSSVPKNGLANCDFSLKYDSSVLTIVDVEAGDIVPKKNDFDTTIEDNAIWFLFDEASGDGLDSIFDDGLFATIVAKIKSGSGLSAIELQSVGAFADNSLKRVPAAFTSGGVQIIGKDAVIFEIGKVSGKVGQQVEIPITLTGVPSVGIMNVDFILNYDSSVLQIIDIVAGDIVPNSSKSFETGIFEDDKMITFLFSEESTDGSGCIFNDGTFAIIKAKILGGSGSSPITLNHFGACADNNYKRLPAMVIDGAVEIGTGSSTTAPTQTKSTPTQTQTNPTPTQSGGDETPNPGEILIKIGKVSGQVGENIEIPVEFKGIPEIGLMNADFLVNYDKSVLKVNSIVAGDIIINPTKSFETTIAQDEGYLVFLFSEDSGDGEESIFHDGVFAVIRATIIGGDGFSPIAVGEIGAFADNTYKKVKTRALDGGVTVGEKPSPTPTQAVTTPPTTTSNNPTPTPVDTDPTPKDGELIVKIDKVSGQPGKTVTIPVKLIGIPDKGIINCDFDLAYDNSVLEIISVEAGEIVSKPNKSFDANILSNDGEIVFLFDEDSGEGTDAIVQDGVFARINAKIKDGAAEGFTSISFRRVGAFADYNLKKVKVSTFDGGVDVKVGGQGKTISGYIVPDLEVNATTGPIIKGGFKVQVVGTELYAVTDGTGYFEIANVPESATGYTLKITKETFLTREIKNVVVTGDVQLGNIEMWAGDIVQDDAIFMTDIVELLKSFNSVEGSSKYNAKADINKNKAINMEDMVIVIKHFMAIPSDYDKQ